MSFDPGKKKSDIRLIKKKKKDKTFDYLLVTYQAETVKTMETSI
jgi:hypothetical protein